MNSDLNSALALFRSLYKAQKGDVYTIIERFILVGVKIKKLLSFDPDEIEKLLDESFHVKIPIAIIKKCIVSNQEVFKYSQGKYVVLKPDNDEVDQIIQEMNRAEEYRTNIINELIQFIEKEKNIAITDDDRDQISQTFSNYIIDKEQVQENAYRLFITEFIIRKENDETFQEFINSMKEGMVIYRGIRYSDSPNDNTWDYETEFFLDVEYLFNAFGLNGPFYERCFMEFYDLVQEVNRASCQRGGRDRIRLYYFPETRMEIDKYFSQAARIRTMDERNIPDKVAMLNILSECEDELQVGYYKVRFYQKLKELKIYEYKNDIDLNEKSVFLIENTEFEKAKNEHFSEEDEIDEVNGYIQIAEYINILGQGKRFYPLEKCKCMFLSEGNLSNKLSRFIKDFCSDKKPQLITRMSVFTELLWFKLKKGVVSTDSSVTFSVVNKAKTIVSGLVHDHLKKQYDEVVNSGEDEEIKKAYYADLRDKHYSPEKINSDTVADDIAFINNNNYLEEYKRTQDRLKKQAARSESLEKELAEEKKSKQEILEKLKSNAAETEGLKAQLQKEKDEKQSMNDRIAMLEENMAKENEQRKQSAVEQARRNMKNPRFFYQYGKLLINAAIVAVFVVPSILWMECEWVNICTVAGTFVAVILAINAFFSKRKIRTHFIKKYKNMLVFEMNSRGVK